MRCTVLPVTLVVASCTVFAACGPVAGGNGGATEDASVSAVPDEDGDGISDADEGRAAGRDTDADGVADYLDDDSDGDGIPDYREAGDTDPATPPFDSDGDGVPDFRDTDSDDNGRSDTLDGVQDIDGDGVANYADPDDDGDGLTDVLELAGRPDAPPDTDGDLVADFQDTDSDADTILDRDERAIDPDMDNLPAFIDLDADGDCVPDRAEAGDADPNTAPVDSDGDNQYDFLDLDSDNDGLLDGLEDTNCNGTLDVGESNPLSADSDGDGVSDLIEVAAGTDPTDSSSNPQANGDFVFVVPYEQVPQPQQDTLDFATDISQADVVFGMDTTGSMSGALNNLKSSLNSLIDTIRTRIPNTGFAVVGYADFPTGAYGSVGDQPFRLMHRVMTANTTAGLASLQDRVNAYTASGGGDSPESGWEMIYQTATGAGTVEGGANVPAFISGAAFPSTPPVGESIGNGGGVGLRSGSLPIVIWVTDACNHNSELGYPYSGLSAATRAQATAELVAMSARVVAIVTDPQTGGCGVDDARGDPLFAINQTESLVPPASWGPVGSRPATCAVGQCCTGQNGAGEPADVAGMCPMLFRVSNSGTGVSDAVAKGVEVLTSYGVLDIGGNAVDDPGDAVDAVAAFVARIEANPSAGMPCAAGLVAVDTNADAVADTFTSVRPGTTVCFDVIPKTNTTVPPLTTPQYFKATVLVEGDGVTTLDTRNIFFLVPPVIPDIPVD